MAFWNRQAALDATHEAIAATCKTILVRTIDQLDVARSDQERAIIVETAIAAMNVVQAVSDMADEEQSAYDRGGIW